MCFRLLLGLYICVFTEHCGIKQALKRCVFLLSAVFSRNNGRPSESRPNDHGGGFGVGHRECQPPPPLMHLYILYRHMFVLLVGIFCTDLYTELMYM